MLNQQQQQQQQQQILLKIGNITNYNTFPLQKAYKLIEAGRSEDILQVQGLSIDGLNNEEHIFQVQWRPLCLLSFKTFSQHAQY